MKALEIKNMENVHGGDVSNAIACAGGAAFVAFACGIVPLVGCVGAAFVIGFGAYYGC